jgi:uncharacterized membrane protein
MKRLLLLATNLMLALSVAAAFAFAPVALAAAATPQVTSSPTASPSTSFSQSSKDAACNGITDTTGGKCDASAGSGVDSAIALILNIFSAIAGVVAVVMIVVGGLKFITSQGDANKTAGARNTILYAVIGLVVVALAQVIVHFVLTKATSLPKCASGQTQTATGGACTP